MDAGIYKIENLQNGKCYIGSAVNLRLRLNNHRTRLNCNLHKNAHLQSAWNKYGSDAFLFSKIIVCSKRDLVFYEQRCIDGYDAVGGGYNIAPQAGNNFGIKRRPEYIAKMAAAKRGKPKSPEALAALREAMQRPDVRAKLSASCKAAIRKPKTPEHIRNAALAQVGKRVSDITRSKLRAAILGKKRGPYVLKKITRANKGRPHSPEHVAALREAWKRRKAAAALVA
jgi:group I intron endonuclease